MKFGEIRKPLMIFCLSTSVALHLGAVWFFISHPFNLEQSEPPPILKASPSPTIVPKDDQEMFVEKMEKALEESLNTVVTLSNQSNSPGDIAMEGEIKEEVSVSRDDQSVKKILVSTPKIKEEELFKLDSVENEFAASMPPLFDPEKESSLSEFALDDDFEEDSFSYQSEKYGSVDLTDHRLIKDPPKTAQLIEDDFTMTDEQFSPSSLPTHDYEGLTPEFISSLKKLKTPRMEITEEMNEEKMFNKLEESSSPKLVLPNSVDYLRSQWIKRSLAERKLPEFNYYGLESIATNLEWEEELDVDVAIMSDPNSNKYVFSLTVHPDFETDCESMKQNFYFLIDRSSSIEKHKFNRFKRAVQRSLSALREGDTFNIYIFDKNVMKLSEKNIAVTPKSIQLAEDFLDREQAKTHFAATEVFSSLEKMLPKQYHPEELHSVILLTDGNTLLSAHKQKKAITEWIDKLRGNVNFYGVASGKGNNLILLDLLSYCTAGKMLYSDTNASLPRKLVGLVKDLHYPIVKNVTIEASPSDPNARIDLYPKNQLLPPMFAGQVYTVTGTIDELCDLTVFIQGKNHDRWLNIRKHICLRDSTKGGRSLEKNWAMTQSKICYEHFLKNGKSTHLKEAKQIVAPYHGAIASEQ